MDVSGPLPGLKTSSGRLNNGFVYVMAALAALTGLLFGYDTGVISGALVVMQGSFNMSTTEKELVTSAVLVGAVLGALFSGRVTDIFGRRKTIITLAIIFTIGAIVAAVAPSIGWIIAGRVILGVAIGVGSYVGPLYIAEVAPAPIRGRLVSFNQLAITFGILVAYVVDFALTGWGGWRAMFAVGAIPSVILLIGMFFLPESPRWLVKQGRQDEALKVLSRTQNAAAVTQEIKAIHSTERQQKGSWRDLFGPGVRVALVIGVGLAILQQVTGINTVIYYAPTILQSAGFGSAQNSILAAALVGIVNFLMTIVAVPLLDRAGRRRLLLIGLAGQIVGLGVLGAVFLLPGGASSLGWLAVAGMIIFVGSFAIGLGPVFWLLISEIYPLRVRGLGASLATMANWGANLVVALTFLSLIDWLGSSLTFWLYGALSILALLFTFYLVPETRGRTLEQIEAAELAGFKFSQHQPDPQG